MARRDTDKESEIDLESRTSENPRHFSALINTQIQIFLADLLASE
jgi:hypothetical protein